jgi:hypothetical protein
MLTVLVAEDTDAQATLPSGNAFHDCHGASGAAMVNCAPTAAPVLVS